MKTIIIGAGGHARVVCSIFDSSFQNINVIAFVDPVKRTADETIYNRPIWQISDLFKIKSESLAVAGIVGVGDNDIRKQRFQNLVDAGFIIPNAIHKSVQISNDASISRGSVIATGAIICPSVKIGENTIINTGAIIEHETTIGAHCHIAPGTAIAGRVEIGEGTFIGIGSVVKDNIKIGNNVIIGAGTVVIEDIPDHCTVVGVPGKIIKRKEQGDLL